MKVFSKTISRTIMNKSQTPWFIFFLISNLFFIFLTWLTGPDTFKSIVLTIVLFTVMILFAAYRLDQKMSKKQRSAFQAYLNEPSEENEQQLKAVLDEEWHPLLDTLSTQLRELAQTNQEKTLELKNYQEFIEAWVHEIKTPLSLATFVLANHKTEMSPYVYQRMEHVRCTINSHVERILYYARLHSDHVDYKFVPLNLADIVQECLEAFHPLAYEKKIEVKLDLFPFEIISDPKVLSFILSQLFSNAFKYAPPTQGIISVSSWSDAQDDGKIYLAVRDNGKGVPPEDLPFIFDKGFTGCHPDRQNATGMGLYLVQKYAEALSIDVAVEPLSVTGQGFGIQLIFPKVHR